MGGLHGTVAGCLLELEARAYLNIVEALLREDVWHMYAGDPEAVQEALDELEELVGSSADSGQAVGLHDAGRDAAWAQLGSG